MKQFITILLLVFVIVNHQAQTFSFLDSLNRFPEHTIRKDLQQKGLQPAEINAHILHLKKQALHQVHFPSANATVQKFQQQTINAAPCVNENFESSGNGPFTGASSVSGWNLSNGSYGGTCTLTPTWSAGSSNFTLVNTPVYGVPGIGTLTQSPLGGFRVAVLNNTVTNDYSVTRLTQTFPVTAANCFFNYAVAASLTGDFGHNCCEASGYQVLFYDCSNNFLCSKSYSLSACPSQSASLLSNGSAVYHPWQTHSVDLSAYINSCVRVEVIANDCAYSGHYGMLYFDAECGSSPIATNIGNPIISFCPGAGYATLQVPPGYPTYTWTVPPPYFITGAQATSSVLGFLNPTTGGVFTLNLGTNLNCAATQTFALTNSSVGISETSTVVSCNPGSTGGATIVPIGSAGGYTYTWQNSTSSVVSTSSILANVPPGVYNVSVSATAGCGIATSSITIPAFTSSFTLLGPSAYTMCPNSFLVIQTSQFSVTGNAATITWSPSTFLSTNTGTVNYIYPQGTPGSSATITYSVVQTPANLICPYTQTFAITYFEPPVPQINSISDVCLNSGTFQANASPAGGTYTSTAFIGGNTGVITPSNSSIGLQSVDYFVSLGPCSNSTTTNFSILPLPSITTASAVNVCANKTTTLTIAGADVYAWNGVPGNTLVITPNTTTIAVASATDAVTNCTNTKTVSIIALPNPTLTVSSVTAACIGTTYTTSVTGANTYTWQNGNNQALITSTTSNGVNTMSVIGSYSATGCKSQTSHSLLGIPMPTLSMTDNPFLCVGQLVSLQAIGAETYSWNGTASSSTFTMQVNSAVTIYVLGSNNNLCKDSLSLSLAPDECLGLSKIANNKITIYPNPASTEFFVSAAIGSQLELIDSCGKLVFTKTLQDDLNSISVSGFAQGIYLLRIEDVNGSKVLKLLVED